MEPKPKRKKVLQRYRVEYTKEWPCIHKSTKSEHYVFCTVCACDFMIQHGGRDDCRRHIESKKHVDNGRLRHENKPISDFFPQNNDENAVMKAEMLFTSFVIEHNVAIASTDHAGALFRAMFPDSKIAKKYGSARTKTSAIIQDLAKKTQRDIVKFLQKNPFSIATDGSNDNDDNKLYPLVISYFNESEGKIDTLLLSICQTSDNTGEGIFNVLKDEFSKKDIPWNNCLSFASDNANTMVGHIKGVVAFLRKIQPSIIHIGCACHLIHLAAKKATSKLASVDIEEFLVKLYYYLDKSSKRKNCFKLCQAVCDSKPHKILKYVSTRWLSLLDSVNRVLEQWDALQHYFCVENNVNSSIKSNLENPMCKLYCLFLSNILPVFNSLNLSLQQEAPLVHILQKKLVSLFMDLIVRFVKPTALKEDAESILDISFNKRSHQKDNDEIVIGAKARSFIFEEKLTDHQLTQFYSEVRNFYCTACDYILKKFPLKEEILKHAEVADISARKTASSASVTFFAKKFSSILTEEELNLLETEFASYQFENFNDLSYERMDSGWHQISQIINPVSGQKKYIALPKLMLAVLLIPHSNAITERVFSIVRKNQTEFRPSLDLTVLNALLVEKVKCSSTKEKCFQRTFSEEQLKSAKKATKLSLQ